MLIDARVRSDRKFCAAGPIRIDYRMTEHAWELEFFKKALPKSVAVRCDDDLLHAMKKV